jgi:phage portal protein BeeE
MGIIQRAKNFVSKGLATMQDTIMASNVPSHINSQSQNKDKRGMQVYTMSQLIGMTGRTKDGQLITGNVEQPIFYLNLEERDGIFRLCSPVNAVVSGRMNRISGLDWTVTKDRKQEDRIAEELKKYSQLFNEYKDVPDLQYRIVNMQIVNKIKESLPDVLPDLSNFNQSLMRWKKKIDAKHTDEADQVIEWLKEPNINDKWEDFVKKYVYDLMIHGAASIYKESVGGRVENFYLLTGGTVLPLKDAYVGGKSSFVQVTQGYEPQIFYSNELCYSQYLPTTARAWGFIPLEALINKIAEAMLFDKLMAEQADGTKLPEKMVIITEQSPFGSMDKEFSVPVDPAKQKRIETKLNQPKKGALMTFSGNEVTVVDLSRENTMSIQMQRQKDIKEDVALVFQASNMEMNISGSDGTSGRSTSEEQSKIMLSKAIFPILKQLENRLNRDIIPFRFGWDYRFAFDSGESELEQIELLTKKMQSGLFSCNELRSDELNLDGFSGEEFDKPQNAQPQQQGTESNPQIVRSVNG